MLISKKFLSGWSCLRSSVVLKGLGLALGAVCFLDAQPPFMCSNTATITQLRAEGLTENAGELIVVCTGGMPVEVGLPAPTVDFAVILNTPVTSRILNPANRATETLLMIDDPPTLQQHICAVGDSCAVPGLGASPQSPYLQPGSTNMWQGQLDGPSSVLFRGVPIAPPGTTGGSRVIRITNIRVNASSLGVGSNGGPAYVTAKIAVSSPALMPINNPTQTVGSVLRGLITTVTTGALLQQCASVTGGNAGSITLSEGFAGAFRTRTTNRDPLAVVPEQSEPGWIFGTESRFYNETTFPTTSPGGNLQVAGLADFGSRLRVTFNGVPVGITSLTLPLQVDNASVTAPNPPTFVMKLVTGESTAYVLAGSGAIFLDAKGNGEAVYEVIQHDTSPSISVTIPFVVSYLANAPNPGTIMVAGSFAPASAVADASASEPIPRFADLSAPQAAVSINACPVVSPQITAPATLQFDYVAGSPAPATQSLLVQSTNPSSGVSFALSKGTGCDWLVLNPMLGTTPATISASANLSGLHPGEFTCAIAVSASSVSGNLPVISATLNIKTPIWAAPAVLAFTFVVGQSEPPVQTISVLSTTPVNFSVATDSACKWLWVTPGGATTPAKISVWAHPVGLTTGNYTCTIHIASPYISNSPQNVVVRLAVVQPTTINVNPSTLSFSYRLGSAAPATQTVTITSGAPSSGVRFSVNPGSGCEWLNLKAAMGVTPFLLSAWVNTSSLTPSTKNCSFTIMAPSAINGPQTVNASLTVGDRPVLRASPDSLTFNMAGGQPPPPQTIFFFAGASIGLSVTADKPWISPRFAAASTPATISISVNPAGLAAGTYQGNISIHSPAGSPVFQTLPVTLSVAGAPVEALSRAESYWFSFVQGDHEPQLHQETISGFGRYRASSDCPWLSVTPNDITISGTAPAVLAIAADPTNMTVGTYTGSVDVSSATSGTVMKALVGITVSRSAQFLRLSQTGMSFRTVKEGKAQPQALYITKNRASAVGWGVVPATLSGGAWLSVTPSNGFSSTSPSAVEVSVNTMGLPPGEYHGQLVFSSPDVANSPQIVGVVLTISPEPTLPPLVDPAGLLINGSSTTQNTISIMNRSDIPMSFESSAYFPEGHAWFTARPTTGTISPGGTLAITIWPNSVGLAAGTVYPGELNLGFGTGAAHKIELLLMVPGSSNTDAGCVPKSLHAILTSLGGENVMSAGRPAAVQVKVADNCGNSPESSGSIQLDLSNGDPSISMAPVSGGLWTATVTPRSASPGELQMKVQGWIGEQMLLPYSRMFRTGEESSQPLLAAQGVSSAASYAPGTAVAPGSLINIYGDQLADQKAQYSQYPLPRQLSGTQVLLNATPIPLMSVSQDRIIAQVPYEIAVNEIHQLIIQRGNSRSAPEAVPVALAQPAVFTVNQEGTGQAVAIHDDGGALADAAHPAKAGDEIVIYCAGLGAVSPRVPSGSAAPAKPLSHSHTPNVTIGGQTARVLSSSLAPGSAGVYLVRAVVPAGVSAGDEVPIVLTLAGQKSPVTTIAVK